MSAQGILQQNQDNIHLSQHTLSSQGTSPNGSSLSLLNSLSDPINSSPQGSPVNLTSSINSLHLTGSISQDQQSIPQLGGTHQTSPGQESQTIQHANQQQSQSLQQQPQTYVVKIKNAPSDISLRESYSIFAFAKDFVGLELVPDSNNLPIIFASFKSLSAASTYSQLLESSQIFGPSYPTYLKAEIVDTLYQPPLNLGSAAKRPSIGSQRSRFLFSDPFNNEAIAENVEPPTNGVGKSLLLLESQQDAREYEQLVRDPWHAGSQQIPPNQQPSSASVSGPTTSVPYGNSNPTTPSGDWERRRQSSAFFNNQSPLLTSQLGSNPIPTQLSLNTQLPPVQPSSQSVNQSGSSAPPSSAPVSQILGPNSSQNSISAQAQSQPSSAVSSSQIPLGNSQQSSQVDLSLLARVPPPANPADQNPPCNTLYVGNLPPDATEAELRQLFSPQRGFRRLSFRTKAQPTNGTATGQTSHSHGPMCFVEFEDVAHATRALAELYGRTLIRPSGISGKGGIRLSFSKNPLGVRGPGQRRSSGFTYQTGFKN